MLNSILDFMIFIIILPIFIFSMFLVLEIAIKVLRKIIDLITYILVYIMKGNTFGL